MVRWEPGAKERLQLAAIELFLAHGYEQTTVQDIAAAAGLTERTFFRHFSDKREVLFVGSDVYAATFMHGVDAAPVDATPPELVSAAITAAARDFFPDERRPWSRRRQAVLDTNPALQERELLKRSALGDALTEAFASRGLPGADARIAAETGVAAFHLAFRQWIADGEHRSLVEIEEDVLMRMAAVMPGGPRIATG